jgi:membrane protein required for colicin V production
MRRRWPKARRAARRKRALNDVSAGVLTTFDYAVIAVVALSALRGLWRGFLAEVFGLIGWIAAFIIAIRFAPAVAVYVPSNWPGGALTQWLIAMFAIVAVVMIVVAVFSIVFERLSAATGLRGVDRSLGMLFGLVRGVMLVLVLVALAGLTELPRQKFWRDALLRPYAEQGVRELKPLLPEALAGYVRF